MPATAVDTATEMFKGLEEKIDVIQADYTHWWTEDMKLARPRIQVLAEAQDFAEKKFENMSLGEQDAYAAQIDSWLPVINAFIPPLQKYYSAVQALVGRIYYVAGFKGDPYKHQVEGDPRVTRQRETMQLVERLSTSISKQSSSISSRNFRISAEIKAGIYSGNVQNIGGEKVPRR